MGWRSYTSHSFEHCFGISDMSDTIYPNFRTVNRFFFLNRAPIVTYGCPQRNLQMRAVQQANVHQYCLLCDCVLLTMRFDPFGIFFFCLSLLFLTPSHVSFFVIYERLPCLSLPPVSPPFFFSSHFC